MGNDGGAELGGQAGKVILAAATRQVTLTVTLHLTVMSLTHDPMDITLTHASPPVTDYNNEPDKDGDDNSSESEGSLDGILRVRNFLSVCTTTLFTMDPTFRTSSRMFSTDVLISTENSPSTTLSHRPPSPIYTFRGWA